MKKNLCFIDLFAGAGGLSEGFIQAGFSPVAHVEIDKAASFTLRTRMAYHWLQSVGREKLYAEYLEGKISRNELYAVVPDEIRKSVINREISEESLTEIFHAIDGQLQGNKLNLIVGGPPCQAYSLVGRSRDSKRMVGDKRNYLYIFYAEFLKRYKPEYFVFENVLGLLSAKDSGGNSYFEAMRQLFRESGYETEYRILSADDYGVLQTRKRIILVGRKGYLTGFYPELEKWNPTVNVAEVFNDLPSLKAGDGQASPCQLKPYTGKWLYEAGIRNDVMPVTWHQSRPNTAQDLEIYRRVVELWNQKQKRLEYNELPNYLKTHNNRTAFVDRFKVVAADLPASHTVVAHLSKDGHYYIHPDISQNRSITPREAARLQTFPDDYYFESIKPEPGRTAAFRQIGNAVPVLLARKIAEKLKDKWI
ncbi:DNA cytosine methyltransferase [Yersinia sp. HM-2024]|uniref:DNA cytosine methyltransferase n=1 Tax=Yersinia sp. HM-2024 TaxID=3344550 RepID=UPI00370D2C66